MPHAAAVDLGQEEFACVKVRRKVRDHERQKARRVNDRPLVVRVAMERDRRVRVNLHANLALPPVQLNPESVEPRWLEFVTTDGGGVPRVIDLVHDRWLCEGARPVRDALATGPPADAQLQKRARPDGWCQNDHKAPPFTLLCRRYRTVF